MIHHAYDFDDNDDDDGEDKNVSRLGNRQAQKPSYILFSEKIKKKLGLPTRQAQTKRVDRHCATNNQERTSPDCRHRYIGER